MPQEKKIYIFLKHMPWKGSKYWHFRHWKRLWLRGHHRLWRGQPACVSQNLHLASSLKSLASSVGAWALLPSLPPFSPSIASIPSWCWCCKYSEDGTPARWALEFGLPSVLQSLPEVRDEHTVPLQCCRLDPLAVSEPGWVPELSSSHDLSPVGPAHRSAPGEPASTHCAPGPCTETRVPSWPALILLRTSCRFDLVQADPCRRASLGNWSVLAILSGLDLSCALPL